MHLGHASNVPDWGSLVRAAKPPQRSAQIIQSGAFFGAAEPSSTAHDSTWVRPQQGEMRLNSRVRYSVRVGHRQVTDAAVG